MLGKASFKGNALQYCMTSLNATNCVSYFLRKVTWNVTIMLLSVTWAGLAYLFINTIVLFLETVRALSHPFTFTEAEGSASVMHYPTLVSH